MNTYLLCNIGSRDLMMLSAEGKTEELRPARPRGLEILEQYADYSSRLVLPIIQPTLEHLIAMDDLARGSAPPATLHIYLLGTDQPDPRFQDTDTLHFARIASRFLNHIYGRRVEVHEDLLIRGINPAMYDEAYEAMGELLQSIQPEKDETVYVLLAGGIPACNTALLLQGVRRFDRNLVAVYKPPDREALFLRVGRQILEAYNEATVIERLHDLDFANALPSLEQLETARDLSGLVRYAAQRLAFDFQSARLTLEQTMADTHNNTRQFINQRLHHSLDDLLLPASGHQRLLALLKELYWNACIVYNHHQYADFLGRVYRFQEAILRYMVETIYSVSTDLVPDVREVNQRSWEEMLRWNPSLVAFGETIQVKGKKLDLRIIARPSYQALLKYATGDPPGCDSSGKPLLLKEKREYYRALVDRVNKLDELVELRHRTIIGHDFAGVSETLLVQRTPENLLPTQYLTGIMDILCRDKGVAVSDYHHIADFVINELRGRTP